MPLHPRRRLAFFACVPSLALVALAGCAPESSRAPLAPAAQATAIRSAAGASAPDVEAARARMRVGHPWFPLTPGRYVDFRIRRLGEEIEFTYVRATLGEPELFFGRLATPLVYGEVPGLLVDDTFFGLRQYFSIAPDGSLWSHGAQNNGFMSHTEPPLRQLLADPKPGDTWQDVVFFESFFPGGIPFFSNDEIYTFTLSERASIDLAGGRFHALRASVVIDDAQPGAAALAAAAFDGIALRADAAVAPVVLARPRGDRPEVPALKGLWYARREGLVARDYPFGPGPGNVNIATFERIGEGTGPIPPPQPAP